MKRYIIYSYKSWPLPLSLIRLSPKERFSSLSLCCFVCVYFPNNQTYFSSFINFVSQSKEKTSLPW